MNQKLGLAIALCGVLSASSRLCAAQPVHVEFFDAQGRLLAGPVALIGLRGLIPGHEFVHAWTVDLDSRVPEPVPQGVTLCFNVDRLSVSLIESLVGSNALQKVVFHFLRIGRAGPAEFFRITIEDVDIVSSRIQLAPTYVRTNGGRDVEHVVGLQFDGETTSHFAVDPPVEQINFIRGDLTGDLALDISDAIQLLGYLFQGGRLMCPRAGDLNLDDSLDLTDPVYILNFLFLGGVPPPRPFPSCADGDPGDAIPCDSSACP